MTEISRQRQHMFRDAIAAIRASFQGPHSEGVAQRVRRGSRQPGSARQTDGVNRGSECGLNIRRKQWFSAQRNEHVVIEGGIRAAPLKITFESRLCRFVQGDEATFPELGTSDHEAIWGDILKAQADGFRYTQPRARQQSEQRAVGVSTQRTVARLGSRVHETLDVALGKDVRDGPLPVLATKDRRG